MQWALILLTALCVPDFDDAAAADEESAILCAENMGDSWRLAVIAQAF